MLTKRGLANGRLSEWMRIQWRRRLTRVVSVMLVLLHVIISIHRIEQRSVGFISLHSVYMLADDIERDVRCGLKIVQVTFCGH